MDEEDEYYNKPLINISDHNPDCNIPEGLMVTGIVGALISVMLTAPVIAIGFVGLWSAGAVAHYTNKNCCVPAESKNN